MRMQRALALPSCWSPRLSSEQLRFYFLHEMNPADPDIYLCRTLRITGVLDVELLRESVLDMARRHDILRSVYPKIDGQPQIWLRDRVDEAFVAIESIDCDRIIEDELRIAEPFAIEEGPLFRVTAISAGDEHAIVFRFHHIILDGTSVRLFLNGLLDTYRGRKLDRPSHQYCDFIASESERCDREWWSAKLADPQVLDLTIGKQRPEQHTREAGTVQTPASVELVSSLRRTCRSLHVTPYMVMMAVLQILLYKVTGKQDVLIGTPIGSRTRVELQPMLGVLLSWVAFRARLRSEMTFADVLANVRNELLEVFPRKCSYESLIAAAGRLPRDPSRNPLLQVTLNYATHRDLPAPLGLSLELDPIAQHETHYDLSVRFEEIGDSISLGLTYYRGAMERETAELLSTALLELAERCLADPNGKISDARLPDRLERAHRVVIASTFTADPIRPALEWWLDQIGLRAEVEIAPIDQVFQTLLGPMASNTRGTNVLLLRGEDWQNAGEAVPELCRLLARAPSNTIVVLCSDRFEAELAEACTHLSFLSWRRLLSLYPVGEIHDPDADADAKAPWSEELNLALGTAIARKIHALVRPAPKVLVLDCDHTLWNGVVGEDGALGISIGEGHRALQRFALERRDAGVLLCLASKNSEADVWEAFEAAPGMLLTKQMIAAHRIDWSPKSSNLRSLAAEMNLGLDSFVFIDDSPAECAEVRASCPEVLVLQLPREEEIPRFLDHLWPLDLRKLTDADRKRSEAYAVNAQRERLRSETNDLKSFIDSLEVRIAFRPLSAENAARAAQLTQRTNQFNTTTIRRSEAELAETEILLADVSDRFGDYGIVGLVSYRCGRALNVDAFMLSCRALGRGVEQKILAELGRIAEARGVERIELAYRSSPKNTPALRFLEAMGTREGDRFVVSIEDALSAPGKLISEIDRQIGDALPSEVSSEVWRKIAALDSIPKIRAELERSLCRSRTAWTAYAPPRDDLESSIARAWSEVLLIDPIGADDDYFAIGGDSIRSLAVVSKMRKLGCPVSVLDLHQHPTVARLASAIRHRSAIAPAPHLSDSDGPYPLSYSQQYIVQAYARENLSGAQPSGAFHVQDRLALRQMPIDALRRAAEQMVERTPILRSRISNGMQEELALEAKFQVVDLSGSVDQEHWIRALLFADRMCPFDPERGKEAMIRFYAIVRSATDIELVVSAHHGFCDGWSLQSFYRDLFALCEGKTVSERSSFRELVDREQRASENAFWKTEELRPTGLRRAGYQPRLIESADWAMIERANERARDTRTSLKAVLLEAFSNVLARRIASPVIAVVTNGRKDDLTAPTEIFGLCWTLVPIRPSPQIHRDLLETEAHARHPIASMFQGHDPAEVAHASFNLTRFPSLEVTKRESFHRFHFPLNFHLGLVEGIKTATMKLTWCDAFDLAFAESLLHDFEKEI